MWLAVVHQRRHPHFGAVADAFYLELHECVGALAQGVCRAHPLLLHQRLDTPAQLTLGDANETPRLHQANAGGLVRGSEQAAEHFRRNAAAGEVAHVAALADCPVDGRAFGITEGVLAHGRNSAAAASGLEGK
ncbi:hypothetical protein D3C78_654490 [compost metagenome]